MTVREVFRRFRSVALAMGLAAILMVAGYFANNFPLVFGESLEQYFFIQYLAEWTGLGKRQAYDDAFFVNVSQDKALVPVYDEETGLPAGTAAITDRAKLYRLLKILNDSGRYKYVIVDLNFDRNEVSESDSLLYDLIARMDRIVVVRDGVETFPREELLGKSALAHYYSTTVSSNFARFEYVNGDDERYIPLKVYEDMNPGIRFRRYGIGRLALFADGRGLCNSCALIAFDSKEFGTFDDSERTDIGYDSSQSFFNLSADLLDNPMLDTEEEREADIAEKAADSYVVVGNFIEDLHDTYIGKRPGPVILYRALKALEEGRHRISLWHELFWFAVYSLIFWFIITGTKLSGFIVRRLHPRKFILFVIGMTEITLVLTVCVVAEYLLAHSIHAVVLPLAAFALVTLYFNYKNFPKDQGGQASSLHPIGSN